jgi:hypothetical protein
MKFEQGKLVKWVNKEEQEIVWMVTDNDGVGVVVHSDGLMDIGTLTNLNDQEGLSSFIGTVHMSSEAAT